MIIVYVQDRDKALCKWSYQRKDGNSTEAIKWGIENQKIKPGNLALTIHVDADFKLETVKTIKHWAIYYRHGEIEAVPDRVGVPVKHNSYKFYRNYMKYGRVKSFWYKLRKK